MTRFACPENTVATQGAEIEPRLTAPPWTKPVFFCIVRKRQDFNLKNSRERVVSFKQPSMQFGKDRSFPIDKGSGDASAV